jgi:hypothetical protein
VLMSSPAVLPGHVLLGCLHLGVQQRALGKDIAQDDEVGRCPGATSVSVHHSCV